MPRRTSGTPQLLKPIATRRCRVALIAALAALASPLAAQRDSPLFETETTLMEVEVRVTDRQGQPASGLTRDQFALVEEGVEQSIATFEYVSRASILQAEPTGGVELATVASATPEEAAAADLRRGTFIYIATRGRREDKMRIYQAVHQFIDENLAPGVFVSIEGSPFSGRASDLTERLNEMLRGRGPGGTGFVDTLAVDLARDIEYSSAFEAVMEEANEDFADEVEEIADRAALYQRLRMYEYIDLIRALGVYPGRKMVVLFSSGLPVDEDNIDIMELLEDEATKARVRFFVYSVGGLVASSPMGDAENTPDLATLLGDRTSGTVVFPSQRRQDGEDGLYELARRTGGRAVLNSNDFGEIFDVLAEETGDYYLLGYYPQDQEQNGRFRRLRVRVEPRGLRVSHQRGYYEERPFQRQSQSERNLRLHQALAFDTPYADLPLEVDYESFRDSAGHPHLVYSVGLHTADIPAESTKKGQTLKLTVVAQALPRDVEGGPSSRPITDEFAFSMTVERDRHEELASDPLSLLHYGSQMRLEPGEYDWKVVVRDDLSGLLGSYQTRIRILEGGRTPGASSLLLTGRIDDITTAKKKRGEVAEDVLEVAGSRFHPTAVKTFAQGRPVYLLYDIYNPATEALATPPSPVLALYHGRERVTSLPVSGHQTVSEPEAQRLRQLAALQTVDLEPGDYTIAAMLPGSGAEAPVIYRQFRIVSAQAR